MPKMVAKAKVTVQSKRRPGSATKTPLRITLKSSSWYVNASQSIGIGRGRDYRGGHQWLRHIGHGQD
jgi:hypothetical protein